MVSDGKNGEKKRESMSYDVKPLPTKSAGKLHYRMTDLQTMKLVGAFKTRFSKQVCP